MAEDCARIVGMSLPVVDENEADFEPLIVTADRRGRGTGSALLNEAADEARRRGIRYLFVRPVARNRKVISFFHKAGFRLLGRLELFKNVRPSKAPVWEPGPRLFDMQLEL